MGRPPGAHRQAFWVTASQRHAGHEMARLKERAIVYELASAGQPTSLVIANA